MQNYEVIDIEDLIYSSSSQYQNLKCSICHNIFKEPKSCGNCLNHFCRNCIQTWRLTKPDECPLCKHFTMNKPVPILINLLSKLKFNCPGRNTGCVQIVPYEQYIKHINTCPQKVIDCNNIGCFQNFKLKQLESHEERCEYAMVQCEWCMRFYTRKCLNSHTATCYRRLVPCQYCSHIFKFASLNHHVEECPKRPINCRWCDTEVLQQQISAHENVCDLKEVNCIGCKNKMTLIELSVHQNTCEDYPVVCTRCTQSIKRKQFDNHGIQECIECLSKNCQEKVSLLKAQNNQLKQRVRMLEISERNRKKSGLFSFSQVLKDSDIFAHQHFAMVRQHKKKNRDRFLMIDCDPLQKFLVQWKLKIKSFKSQWFAIGISDQSNVYAIRRYQTVGHCSYLASANGTIYSTHNLLTNHQRADFQIHPGDILECTFEPALLGSPPAVSISNTTQQKFVRIEIKPSELENKKYYPCVCFRYAGDTVEILPYQ